MSNSIIIVCAVLFGLAAPPLAFAQDVTTRMTQLETRLAQLEARIAGIEAVQNQHATPAPSQTNNQAPSPCPGGQTGGTGGMGHM